MRGKSNPKMRGESVRSFHEDSRRHFGESSQGFTSEKNLINFNQEWHRRATSPTYASNTNLPSTTVLSGHTHKLRREETITKKKIAWERIDTIKTDMYRQHLKNRIDLLFYGKNTSSDFRVKRKKVFSERTDEKLPFKVTFQAGASDIQQKTLGEFKYWLIEAKKVEPIPSKGQPSVKIRASGNPSPATVMIQSRLATQPCPESANGNTKDLTRLRNKFFGFVRKSFGQQDLPHLLCDGPINRI